MGLLCQKERGLTEKQRETREAEPPRREEGWALEEGAHQVLGVGLGLGLGYVSFFLSDDPGIELDRVRVSVRSGDPTKGQ